jgi:hypothetical protein
LPGISVAEGVEEGAEVVSGETTAGRADATVKIIETDRTSETSEAVSESGSTRGTASGIGNGRRATHAIVLTSLVAAGPRPLPYEHGPRPEEISEMREMPEMSP